MTHYGGRNPIGEKAMTGNERQKRYYEAHKAELLLKRQRERAEASRAETHEPLKGERYPPCKLCHHETHCKAIQAREPRWDTWRHDDRLVPFPCMP